MLESEKSLGCDEKFELPVELEGRSGELINGREENVKGSQLVGTSEGGREGCRRGTNFEVYLSTEKNKSSIIDRSGLPSVELLRVPVREKGKRRVEVESAQSPPLLLFPDARSQLT